MLMTRRRLMRLIDTDRVARAIATSEQLTSGEIRVSLARFFWGDPRRAAERAFARLGMANTRERNGVLIFLVPARRRFVILGDEGIHAHVGAEFWEQVAAAMSAKFRAGDFTAGLEAGIREVGERLAAHFPRQSDDRDELPNEVDYDDEGA